MEHQFKTLDPQKRDKSYLNIKSGVLIHGINKVEVNIPEVGRVIVPYAQLKHVDIIPASQLNLLAYDDFKAAKRLQGTVTTKSGEVMEVEFAYDLDETYDFENIDGLNNDITYSIPFKYIQCMEPKNYKYSFIRLVNGAEFSIGGLRDVNRENSGLMCFGKDSVPIYIEWDMVEKIELKH